MAILTCNHASTCLSDYWGGHHLPHVSIPVYRGMSFAQIKRDLHSELAQGAVAGNDPATRDDSGEIGDRWYKRAHAAVNRMRPYKKGQRAFFLDLDDSTDDDDVSVYAFFVFVAE